MEQMTLWEADIQDKYQKENGFAAVENMLRETDIPLEKACRIAQISVEEYKEQKNEI